MGTTSTSHDSSACKVMPLSLQHYHTWLVHFHSNLSSQQLIMSQEIDLPIRHYSYVAPRICEIQHAKLHLRVKVPTATKATRNIVRELHACMGVSNCQCQLQLKRSEVRDRSSHRGHHLDQISMCISGEYPPHPRTNPKAYYQPRSETAFARAQMAGPPAATDWSRMSGSGPSCKSQDFEEVVGGEEHSSIISLLIFQVSLITSAETRLRLGTKPAGVGRVYRSQQMTTTHAMQRTLRLCPQADVHGNLQCIRPCCL